MLLAPNVLVNQPFAPHGEPMLCSLWLQAVGICRPVPFEFVVRMICRCLCCIGGGWSGCDVVRVCWWYFINLLGFRGVSTCMFGHNIWSGESRKIFLGGEGDFMFDWILVDTLLIFFIDFEEEKFGASFGIGGLSSEVTKNKLGSADVMMRNNVADGESWCNVVNRGVCICFYCGCVQFEVRSICWWHASHWGFPSIIDNSLFRCLGKSIVCVFAFLLTAVSAVWSCCFFLGLDRCFGS